MGVTEWQSLRAIQADRVFGLGRRCLGPKNEACQDDWIRVFASWRSAALSLGLPDAATSTERMPPARWISLWFRLHSHLSQRAPDVAAMLRRGGMSHFDEAAEQSPIDISSARQEVLGMWQVFDGQNGAFPDGNDFTRQLDLPRELRSDSGWTLGVFGGFSVYEHTTSMFFLPFETGVKLANLLRARVPPLRELEESKVVFACNQGCGDKLLFVDVIDGGVFAWDGSKGLIPAVPASSEDFDEHDSVQIHGLEARPELNGAEGTLVQFHHEKGRWQVKMEDGETMHLLKSSNLKSTRAVKWPLDASDGLLRWFEKYVSRLEDDVYVRMPLVPEEADVTRGLNLFPVNGPRHVRCVTRGVEVTASCIYMPGHPQGWTYSITFGLVGDPSDWGFESCQLHTRTWEISSDGSEPQVVNGEAVIGFKPILVQGGWLLNKESDPHGQYHQSHGHVPGPFRYQSASGRSRHMRGTFGGHVLFYPGTVRKPTGQPFKVLVPQLQLSVPTYIF